MSGGASGGFSRSSYNHDQNVFGPQAHALGQLYQQLGGLFNTTNAQMQEAIPGAVQANQQITEQMQPVWQDQMQGGAYGGLNIGNQLMNSLNQSQNNPSAMQEINSMIMGGSGNNYADAMRNQYLQDASSAQQSMLANLDARAAASGMSGGSRHGIAAAQGMDNINRNLQSNMANLGYQTFDKDLDRKLAIAQQADQGTLARQNMLQNMLAQEQAARFGGLNFGNQMQASNMGRFAPYMMPWQAAGVYGQGIGAPTVLSSGHGKAKSVSQSGGGGM